MSVAVATNAFHIFKDYLRIIQHEFSRGLGVKVLLLKYTKKYEKDDSILWIGVTGTLKAWHLMNSLPKHFIILQTEPLYLPKSRKYIDLLNQAKLVLDYAPEIHLDLACYTQPERVRFLPVGYSPLFQRKDMITPSKKPLHDVFLFGGMIPRRERVIKECKALGLSALGLQIFGPERNEYIANSTILLSVRNYTQEHKLPDYFRIIPLLCNKKFVVAEDNDPHAQVNHLKDLGVPCVPIENIAETCLYFIKHPEERKAVMESIYEKLQRKFSFQHFLGPLKEDILNSMND